eukprot:TRINITY_DN21436_c0_g1_i2.p1 TRINITY_DN21436_c0_g1~~TRINITY_DN21436_c0_g1_i2.p1  ORF type:complete len:389 (-),score=70.41 TRINITY_DN21436_c0_g1_i2:272-1390(-)
MSSMPLRSVLVLLLVVSCCASGQESLLEDLWCRSHCLCLLEEVSRNSNDTAELALLCRSEANPEECSRMVLQLGGPPWDDESIHDFCKAREAKLSGRRQLLSFPKPLTVNERQQAAYLLDRLGTTWDRHKLKEHDNVENYAHLDKDLVVEMSKVGNDAWEESSNPPKVAGITVTQANFSNAMLDASVLAKTLNKALKNQTPSEKTVGADDPRLEELLSKYTNYTNATELVEAAGVEYEEEKQESIDEAHKLHKLASKAYSRLGITGQKTKPNFAEQASNLAAIQAVMNFSSAKWELRALPAAKHGEAFQSPVLFLLMLAIGVVLMMVALADTLRRRGRSLTNFSFLSMDSVASTNAAIDCQGSDLDQEENAA